MQLSETAEAEVHSICRSEPGGGMCPVRVTWMQLPCSPRKLKSPDEPACHLVRVRVRVGVGGRVGVGVGVRVRVRVGVGVRVGVRVSLPSPMAAL